MIRSNLHTNIVFGTRSIHCHCFVTLSVMRKHVTFTRFKNNPIITADMLPSKEEGDDINGPCLIEAPDWLPNKLGKYYLYFAHHKGKYIRLAYADDIHGPWKIYTPGTLHIEDCICNNAPFASGESIRHTGAENAGDEVTHIASPDVLVDAANKQLVLYFHCPLEYNGKKGQYSLRAVSKDGIHFKADSLFWAILISVFSNTIIIIIRWQEPVLLAAQKMALKLLKEAIILSVQKTAHQG